MWKIGLLNRDSAVTVLDCGNIRYTVMLAGRLTETDLDRMIGKKVSVRVVRPANEDEPAAGSIWVSAVEPAGRRHETLLAEMT